MFSSEGTPPWSNTLIICAINKFQFRSIQFAIDNVIIATVRIITGLIGISLRTHDLWNVTKLNLFGFDNCFLIPIKVICFIYVSKSTHFFTDFCSFAGYCRFFSCLQHIILMSMMNNFSDIYYNFISCEIRLSFFLI